MRFAVAVQGRVPLRFRMVPSWVVLAAVELSLSMTINQFRCWLQERIDLIQDIPVEATEADHRPTSEGYVREAYHLAVDLGLAEAADAATKSGEPIVQLLAVLDAIPVSESDTLTPPQIARQLGVSPDTVRGWCHAGQLKASNVAKRGKRVKWKVARQDLEAFLEKRQPDTRPPKKRKPKLLVEKY